MASATDVDVLIVGAGPTGLVLALWLARAGLRPRIVDKAREPGTTSRALVVHARTLEFYRQLGIADTIVAAGLQFTAVNLWVKGHHTARVAIGDIGRGLSPFPYMIILAQDEHERLLVKKLEHMNVRVERGVELAALAETDEGITATLRGVGGGSERVTARYVAGCDGARSVVRAQLGLGFPGSTYEALFYVADVEATGPPMNGELNAALDAADLLAVFPMKGDHRARFIGTVRAEDAAPRRDIGWDDVSRGVIQRLHVDVERVNWFSTYHVHHRVANHFRRGRAFVLGDAAHIHSPVGGQGMNTGIGDAVNLAWKLVAVLQGAPETLLDSYEPERIGFARRLVATTDRAFTFVTRNGPIARAVRLRLLPVILPPLTRTGAFRRFMFRTISQTAIEYHASPLSSGRAGRVRGGDRLPWLQDAGGGTDNYVPLAKREWQVHVYGEAPDALVTMCRARQLALHVFSWSGGAERAGFARDAAYVVRPDGHVAAAMPAPFAQAAARGIFDALPLV